MTANKRTVQTYMNGFRKSDHKKVLSCLAEDIVWDIPGSFHLTGKVAFDREIENPAFTGRPAITLTRLVEENDTVVAEGAVRVRKKNGGFLKAVFCDVFVLKNAKIKRLTSYLVGSQRRSP